MPELQVLYRMVGNERVEVGVLFIDTHSDPRCRNYASCLVILAPMEVAV